MSSCNFFQGFRLWLQVVSSLDLVSRGHVSLYGTRIIRNGKKRCNMEALLRHRSYGISWARHTGLSVQLVQGD